MAALILFAADVCDECRHTDCAASRKIASSVCVHCDGHIGYGKRFYEVFRSEDGKACDYAHATCHEHAIAEGKA